MDTLSLLMIFGFCTNLVIPLIYKLKFTNQIQKTEIGFQYYTDVGIVILKMKRINSHVPFLPAGTKCRHGDRGNKNNKSPEICFDPLNKASFYA